MTGLSDPHGIALMSDGNIVVTGSCGPVGVFDTWGTQFHLWYNYHDHAEEVHSFTFPWYPAVDCHNNIVISDGNIIKLNKTGTFLYEWPAESPCGLVMVGDMMLAVHEDLGCVMAYNLEGGNATPLLTWDQTKEKEFGQIKSLSLQGDRLVVIGYHGLMMFRLTGNKYFHKTELGLYEPEMYEFD